MLILLARGYVKAALRESVSLLKAEKGKICYRCRRPIEANRPNSKLCHNCDHPKNKRESAREASSYKWTWKNFYAAEFESNMPAIKHIMKRCFAAGREAFPEAPAAPKESLIVIEGGGDWTDASYVILRIAPNTDMEKCCEEYKKFLPSGGPGWISFNEWLVKNSHAVEERLPTYDSVDAE